MCGAVFASADCYPSVRSRLAMGIMSHPWLAANGSAILLISSYNSKHKAKFVALMADAKSKEIKTI